MAKRDQAARFLQRVWKRFRLLTMVPKAWRAKKKRMMSTLQKCIRGYCVHKRVIKELNTAKLKQTFDFFDSIKNNLLDDAQIKISYRWRRYKKDKKKKKKTKKKGKKANMNSTITSTTTVKKNR